MSTKPYVGQRVLFTGKHLLAKAVKNAAIVAFVNTDASVNLAVFNHSGNSYGVTDVRYATSEDEIVTGENYCEPMDAGIDDAKAAPADPTVTLDTALSAGNGNTSSTSATSADAGQSLPKDGDAGNAPATDGMEQPSKPSDGSSDEANQTNQGTEQIHDPSA